MFNFNVKYSNLVIFFLLILSISCRKKEKDSVDPLASSSEIKNNIVKNYANLVFNNYEDTYNKALFMNEKVKAFVLAPTQEGLETCKKAWIDARIPYLQTEAFRFYQGPIDGADGPEGLLNAWPLDEAYIDYVQGNPIAGIINNKDKYTVIDKSVVQSLNESSDNGGAAEKNISAGYHAIEFLLWGQDTSSNSPGKRPFTDFVDGGTAMNQSRRRQYLSAVTELLMDKLKFLVDAWSPNTNNYRNKFVIAPSDSSITKILLGIGSLSWGEMGSERLAPAYEEKSQEEENSCFSDNTLQDFIYDEKGIENVFYGRYIKADGMVIDGPGIDDLVALKNSALNIEIKSILENTAKSIAGLKYPFDQEILNSEGRIRIQSLIKNLDQQTKKIAEVAQSLGIQLSL